MDGLVDDLKDFLASEKLYHEAGIPHRRGVLLEGPPGTGKTSTICSIAGELGLEVFSLSLSAGFLDDMGLQTVVSSTPKGCILVIEDIDCAFAAASREDEDDEDDNFEMDHYISPQGVLKRRRKTAVTLSGLLNVIDGIGSDEGKIFFTTTNYVERLDSALLRPGRIDRRIRYHMATQIQAYHMFRRFFPEERLSKLKLLSPLDDLSIKGIAKEFSAAIPEDEFSTAELQGFLLGYKNDPTGAARDVASWIETERADKVQREEREKLRKDKNRQEARRRRERQYLDFPTTRSSAVFSSPPPPFPMYPTPDWSAIPSVPSIIETAPR
jgi:chaperone BCS1